MQKNKNISIWMALLAAGLFGASAPLAKLLLDNVDPIPMAALLYLGSGLSAALASRWIFKPGQEAKLGRANWPWLAGAVLAGGVGAPILLMAGLKITPAALAALLLNFETVATALIAYLFFKESIGRKTVISIVLITIAVILLSWSSSGEWGFSLGALAVLGACFLWGLDNNFTNQISAHNPLLIVAVKGLGAAAFSMILSLISGQVFPSVPAALAAMALGAVSYGASITLFVLSMRQLGAARTSALFASAPFMGAVLSFILFKDNLTLVFLAATVLMVAGVWVLVSENHAHSHVHAVETHHHRHVHDEHHQHAHQAHDPAVIKGEHAHEHSHAALEHSHAHTPDLHHRHEHG
ncbi:MAG TPA: DMT family transporter [Anaerolineaceae bacterium]|nr:DMT family transporter [Anaerolineaceae bacterium]HPN49955.1 DMT family transporter [Anaerolineaceae bacterium]